MPLLGSIIKKAIEFRGIKPLEIVKVRRRGTAYGQQVKMLEKLLKKSINTAFGDHYNFGKLLDSKDLVAAFQQTVPVHDYNSIFSHWWYRQLNGESFVTWPGKVRYYALSSGTSEASSKYIPVTPDMIRAIRRTSIRQLVSLANYNFPRDFYEKGILMLGGSTHLQFNGTYYEGDLSGINTAKIPFWFQHFYKPGKRISRERDWNTKLEEIIRKAPEWDIGSIVGVPAWYQILLEMIIKRYNLSNIHDIWPNLRVFCHGGVAFGPYKNGFEKLLGKPITYIETYLASEGFIAYQNRPDSQGMQLVLDNGLFYEFVPFNSQNFDEENKIVKNPVALTLDQVEEGKEYALLLSSVSGAWRYLIGDTIRFTNLSMSEIIITGRTRHFLNLCGEHLSQENMNRAVEMLENQENIHIREFTVAGIRHGSMFAHKWFIGTDDPVTPETAARRIDENLKKLNDDYRVERIAAIRDVIVEVLPIRAFYDWMEVQGKIGSQNKFPRVMKNQQYEQWEEHVNKYKR
ncbi:MAG: GH3 auxin-responsive promoter family protein [Bacteroidales bacterium]